MKLYYTKGACSQVPHIVLHEAGLPHESAMVDLRAKKLGDGSDYLRINPKGAVPALELDDGQVLTENAVILHYIADHAGAFELLPQPGDMRRYRVLEWVNFVATELHKSFSPLFNPAAGEETRQLALDTIAKKLDFVEQQLDDKPYLMGEQFTLPDAYLFVMLGWARGLGIDLDRWPRLAAYRERVSKRESVREVLAFEGLLETAAAD